MPAYTDNTTVLNAVTTTTTSSAYDVSKRSTLAVMIFASSITSGNGLFEAQFSNDGTNWIAMAAMQDAQSTAATTYVTSKTLSANTVAGLLIPTNGFQLFRMRVTRTTDGTYSAILQSSG